MKQRLREEVANFSKLPTPRLINLMSGAGLLWFGGLVTLHLLGMDKGPLVMISIMFGGVVGLLLGVLASILTERWQQSRRKKGLPKNARFIILLLMPNATGDALLGCLEEGFHKIANDETRGSARARFWYWFQVMISLWPLAWAFVKRISGLAIAYEAIRKAIK
jgi:hypothetical protein